MSNKHLAAILLIVLSLLLLSGLILWMLYIAGVVSRQMTDETAGLQHEP